MAPAHCRAYYLNISGGRRKDIKLALKNRFPEIDDETLKERAILIDQENTITACHFCNSATSRWPGKRNLITIILQTVGDWHCVLSQVRNEIAQELKDKEKNVKWKLDSVERYFEKNIKPELQKVR